MKKKIFLLILLFNIVSLVLFGQDSAKTNVIIPNQIYYQQGVWVRNNQFVGESNAVNYLKTNKEAFRLYKKSSTQESIGQTIGVLGVLALFGSALAVNNDNHLSGKLSIGSLVGIFSGIIISNRANKRIQKAVCIYNTQLIN